MGTPGNSVSRVPQQKVQRRLHHRDDEIQRLVRVLAAIKVGYQQIVAGPLELREAQGLAVDLDPLPELGSEGLAQAAIDARETGEVVLVLVIEESGCASVPGPQALTELPLLHARETRRHPAHRELSGSRPGWFSPASSWSHRTGFGVNPPKTWKVTIVPRETTHTLRSRPARFSAAASQCRLTESLPPRLHFGDINSG